jgi:hypothetical protein
VALGGTPELAGRLEGVVEDPERVAVALTARQVWRSVPLLARQTVRSYAPILLVASLASRRARRASLLVAGAAALGRWVGSDAALDPVRFSVISTLDDLAYCSGVWRGALATRRSGALRPRIVRPSRSDSVRGAVPPTVG